MSIAAESLALAECPKCDRERAATQDYRLTVILQSRPSITPSELPLLAETRRTSVTRKHQTAYGPMYHRAG